MRKLIEGVLFYITVGLAFGFLWYGCLWVNAGGGVVPVITFGVLALAVALLTRWYCGRE